MIRIVTTTEKPTFFLLCDRLNCNFSSERIIETRDQKEFDALFVEFMQDMIQQIGWAYSVFEHVCPGCVKRTRELQEARQQRKEPLIAIATPQQQKHAQRSARLVDMNGRKLN